MSVAGRPLPRAYWVLWAGTAFNQVGNALVIPFLAVDLALRLHTGPAGVGLVLTLQGGAQVAASFLGGQLADRLGRKITMAGSLIAASGTTALLGVAHTAWGAAGLLVLRGLMLPLYGPASSAMVADIVPGPEAYGAFGLLRVGSNVGFMIGPAVGAFLAEAGTPSAYRTLFLLSAGILAAYAVVTLAALPETRPAPAVRSERLAPDGPVEPAGTAAPRTAGAGRVGRTAAATQLVTFLVSLAALGTVYSQLYWVLPNYMALDLHLASSHFGFLASENALVVVLLSVPVLRWTRRWSPARAVARGALAWAGGFALIALCRPFWSLLAPVFVISVGEILVNPAAAAYVAAQAAAQRRGRMLSWVNVANRSGAAIGPLAGGLALADLGPWGPWLGAAALGVAAAWVVAGVARRDTPRGDTQTGVPTALSPAGR